MTRVLEELIRVLAYGGIGMWAGFISGGMAADRHRLISTILDGAERDMPTSTRRRYLQGQALQSATILIVMVAMLLTGLSWMQQARTNANQDHRECERLAEVSRVLRNRTAVYREAAIPERQLWLDLRKQFIQSGAKPDSPTMRSIDAYLVSQKGYVDHLERNPYPELRPGECE